MRMTINLPETTAELIKQKAASEGQSASFYITQVMEVHLKEEKRKRSIQKVLEVVKKGAATDDAIDILHQDRRNDRV